jgi:hypothetical protein
MLQSTNTVTQGVQLAERSGIFFPAGILIDREKTAVLTGLQK